MITENFTITVSPAVTLVPGINNFLGTSVAQFNPGAGMLTSISLSLTGTGTWTDSGANPHVLTKTFALANGENVASSQQDFFTTGAIMFNQSGSSSDSNVLAAFTGAGSVTTELTLQQIFGGDETFAAISPGLSGTLTYTFTPAGVPEPSSALVLLSAVAGLLGMRRLPAPDCRESAVRRVRR
jgi:hypothetical protein